jgi:hypothetical protein
MRYRLALLAAAAVSLGAILTSPARSAAPMSPGTIGVGPHGYDFLVGTWSCKNSVPSPMGGPATSTVVIARGLNGSLTVHVSGANFAAMAYVVYAAKTKTWWNPSAGADGSYGTESSQQTGKKTVWSGPYTDASGKTMQQRDTYTWPNSTTYTDLYQVEMGGAWKTEGDSTCTKT